MSPLEFVHLVAHGAAAELLRLNVQPADKECVGLAIVECAGVRLVVSLTRYEGPATIAPETLARIEAMKAKISPQEQRILAVLAGQTEPRKATWIALRLGKKNADGGLRQTLSGMLRKGLLIKGANGFGYRIPAKEKAAEN